MIRTSDVPEPITSQPAQTQALSRLEQASQRRALDKLGKDAAKRVKDSPLVAVGYFVAVAAGMAVAATVTTLWFTTWAQQECDNNNAGDMHCPWFKADVGVFVGLSAIMAGALPGLAIGFFVECQVVQCSEKAKENGKLRVEGKDYLVKDGDVLFFRVNV